MHCTSFHIIEGDIHRRQLGKPVMQSSLISSDCRSTISLSYIPGRLYRSNSPFRHYPFHRHSIKTDRLPVRLTAIPGVYTQIESLFSVQFDNLFQRNGVHRIGYISRAVTDQRIFPESRIFGTHHPETHAIATGTTGIQSDRIDIESGSGISRYRKFNIAVVVYIYLIFRPFISFDDVALSFRFRIDPSIYPSRRISRFGITVGIHLAENFFCCQDGAGYHCFGILT